MLPYCSFGYYLFCHHSSKDVDLFVVFDSFVAMLRYIEGEIGWCRPRFEDWKTPKDEVPPMCWCGDPCKVGASYVFDTLWQRYWGCANDAYDRSPGGGVSNTIYPELFVCVG